MKTKIQWKLMVSHLALAVLIASVFYGYLNYSLKNRLVAEARESLLNEARLVRIMSSREIRVMGQDALSLARNAGREIKARISIITDKGVVVGDSELGDADIRKLENHGNRPEFRQALATGSGSAIRYSATLGSSMLYVALPFRTQQGDGGVIRLALPLSHLDVAMASMHNVLIAALVLAVACSLLLSYILSSITSHPLRTMAAVASRIGKGDFSSRIPVASHDEVGELAAVMNEMAGRIEQQLERISAERNRLDTILNSMGEGVIVTDREGIVTLANPAFLGLFSLEEHVAEKPLVEITRLPSMLNALRKVLETREEILEEIAVQAPGERHMLAHWVPLVEEGRLSGTVAVFHDITDLKMLEKIRKDFVANVSHELRTPVSVIKGYAETLLSGGQSLTPEKNAHFTGIIYSHAERLANLISDLLTLSRIESGVMTLEPVSLEIEPAVGRSIRLLEKKAHDKGIKVISAESLKAVPSVLADPGKLEQVLVNLLDNAIKFTPSHGTVTLSAEDIGTHVRIDVHDTGIGIPPQDLQRIFERFYRVDTARSRDLGGTGLGLSIVKHIVQAHGGSVSVESMPGKGSTFSFTLRKAY